MRWLYGVLAFCLGGLLCGLGLHIGVSHQASVDELVATGYPVQAKVTQTRRQSWSQIEYQVDGKAYTARLKSEIGTVLPLGETILVYVDTKDPLRVTTAEGEATFTAPVGTTGFIGIGTGVILIYLCLAGTKIWRDRWAAIDTVKAKAPRIRRGRGVVRRRDLPARIISSIIALFPLAGLVGGDPWGATAIAAPLFVLMALLGWGAKVTVTSESLDIYSLVRRTSVPRSLIREISPDWIGLLIRLHNWHTVPIQVGMSGFWSRAGPDPRDYRAAQLKTMARLTALFETIPQTPPSVPAEVSTQPRYWPMVLLAASVLAALAIGGGLR